MRVVLLLSLCVFAGALVCAAGVRGLDLPCRGPGGRPVDSFVALKAPGGEQYVYADVDSPPSSFGSFQQETLQSASSAVGATIQQLLSSKSNSSVGWVFYNDETPSGKTSSWYAHAKGVLGFTDAGGFWLIHSVPQFPDSSTSQYTFPDPQSIYGQSFICITVDISTINEIAYQLSVDHPQIYDNYVPDAIRTRFPDIARIQDDWTGKDSNIVSLRTVGGRSFTSFAKSRDWGKMLYGAMVAPSLSCALDLETWMRPVQPSCCSPECKWPVTMADTLQLASVSYTETQDHSKWAVSSSCDSGSSDYFCVGDINHNDSQEKRGGGTLCGRSSAINGLFRSVIQTLDTCKS